MSIKAIIGGYINKFYGGKGEYRTNKYLLISKRGILLDYNGFGDTRRELHDYQELDSIEAATQFLDEHVAKSDREDWAFYKRYERLPQRNATKPGAKSKVQKNVNAGATKESNNGSS